MTTTVYRITINGGTMVTSDATTAEQLSRDGCRVTARTT